ncbi:hypothetical protein BBEV_2063 [Salisediminibacterium beveridgei]|uniref:AI-2E family transporter n=1 Tax=Salisediminibacterium beveridgei TaxID=632773 RepID=A0A1D7QWP2_9BACI|nr:hypothetical protein BBEV_2047 [Salisediminibacterium beveridgei]AOM83421.1 hypothetical protein BBEV_2063 [Salisediminibacterium beveridgei]
MLQSKVVKNLLIILLLLLIVLVGTQVSWIFTPLQVAFQTMFLPFLLAGVLFYLIRPVVNLLEKYKVPRVVSILLIYIAGIGLVTFIVFLIGPTLQRQTMNLIDNAPMLFEEVRKVIVNLESNQWIEDNFQPTDNFSIEDLTENIAENLSTAFDFIGSNIAGFIGAVTSFILVIVVLPFILFFLLKDGDKAPDQVLRFLPEKQQVEGRRILSDMDDKLSSYIQGQLIVSLFVGTLMFIAYLIIGVDYSLILALVAMVTNVVPFVGPWIGTIPAVIVAVIDSWVSMLWVIVAIIIVQQIESNLISPNVMGKKLKVHPLTIIVLILVAGRFGGLIGLIIAVPLYAVTKVVVSHTYRLLQLRKKVDEELNHPDSQE